MFYNNFEQSDDAVFINGEKMPALDELLDAIDWNWLSDGLAGRDNKIHEGRRKKIHVTRLKRKQNALRNEIKLN